jgi:hypothetical protein
MRNFQVVSQNLININRKRTKKELSDFRERERTRKKKRRRRDKRKGKGLEKQSV